MNAPKTGLRDDILQELRRAMEALNDAPTLSPTTLARFAFEHYRAKEKIEPHIEYGTVEHYKQLSRELLSGRFSPAVRAEQMASGQQDAFSELLQDRYPVAVPQGSDPQYKRRELMSLGELDWNIEHIRKAGHTLLAHGDALQAYRDIRADEGDAA